MTDNQKEKDFVTLVIHEAAAKSVQGRLVAHHESVVVEVGHHHVFHLPSHVNHLPQI